MRSGTGQDFALFPVRSAGWAPVKQLSWTSWHMSADDPSENDEVLTQAAETWAAYVGAARTVLGDPSYAGAWDDPAFPEPPHDRHWLMPSDLRLEDMDPYRMAVWREAGPEGHVTVLAVKPGSVRAPGALRRTSIKATCYPPEAM